ncbi:MAG: carboxylating nicotinate-nucleotide diphosphorylase [Planctomycetota bacterium]
MTKPRATTTGNDVVAWRDYSPVGLDESTESDLRHLVRLAIAEDLDRSVDWTTVALIDVETTGACEVVPRSDGVVAGVALVPWILDEFDSNLEAELLVEDGSPLIARRPIVRVRGSARDLLTSERVLLNILSRLCGVATLTQRYLAAMGEHPTRLYDTRKTTAGWRRIEKYAVRCGGAHNHRSGLYDGFLIKDNHLALGAKKRDLVSAARHAVSLRSGTVRQMQAPEIVEIEVDTLDQFQKVLPTGIDIILLDNFAPAELREAVRLRDAAGIDVDLEASGNVTIDTISTIAATGVDRISCGALTHQAVWLDLGMDWIS